MTPQTQLSASAFPDGIIDAHHHLYVRKDIRYLADDYLADIRSTGVNFTGSIHVQARSHYRTTGPEILRPLGETEFLLNQVARGRALGFPGLCLGIVGAADLTQGAAARGVIEEHLTLAGHVRDGGRFCGIRHITSWDDDARLLNPAYPTSPYLMDDPKFLDGLRVLIDLDLAFDACLLAPQLPALVRLAQCLPHLRIVLNHCGNPVGTGAYVGRFSELFDMWSSAVDALSQQPNVFVKLGGLGMVQTGLVLKSDEVNMPMALAQLWQPWFERLFETFGPDRLMLESNSPADRFGYRFASGWAAFGHFLEQLSQDERRALCADTAAFAYRLTLPKTMPIAGAL